jgi:hypothetical protein
MFLSCSTQVLTVAMNSSKRIWSIEPEERPVPIVSDHAKLLAASTVSRFGKFASDQSESMGQVWQQLRKQYPYLFSTSEADARHWHEFAAEESETNADWYSDVIHLKWLLSANPTDTTIRARLISATEKFKGRK